VLAWLVIVSYLTLTALNRRLPVGVFLLPVVLILIGAAYFVSDLPNESVTPKGAATARDIANNWAMLHAALLVFGITGVVVGFVLSMMYVVQHRRLKHHQPMVNNLALPSLERLARLNRYAVVISIPLLTLGMFFGLVGLWSRKGPNPISFVDPVVLTSSIVWLVMIVFLVWLLATKRPVGKQVAWITIWAFGFLLATLIGLEVLTGGHKRPSPLGTHNRQFQKYPLRTSQAEASAADGNQNTKSTGNEQADGLRSSTLLRPENCC
jgi:ABC-type transport system involved in cytochrome c biogenesis permease subunit